MEWNSKINHRSSGCRRTAARPPPRRPRTVQKSQTSKKVMTQKLITKLVGSQPQMMYIDTAAALKNMKKNAATGWA